MRGSRERVRRVMAGERPDRAPLFDLLPNDAVLKHFNGGVAVEIGDDRSGIRAIAAAIDGSRQAQYSPSEAGMERLPDGRERRAERWTAWEQTGSYSSSEEYREVKRREIAERRKSVSAPIETGEDEYYLRQREVGSWFGEDFYFLLGSPSPNLMGVWREVGLEEFGYYFYDCEAEIVEQLELNTEHACQWVEGLPEDDPFEAVFIGEDIAFKGGPMMRVDWLEREYMPRMARVIEALHGRGKKVVFHSDGNLNAIMDGLVEAGIDGLNPVERVAGMDLADLHRRYPGIVFVGGIDVSHLLPFGTPQQVRDAVVQAIEETEGRILVGSSTEVFDIVPLENFLAMREAAMGYGY